VLDVADFNPAELVDQRIEDIPTDVGIYVRSDLRAEKHECDVLEHEYVSLLGGLVRVRGAGFQAFVV
jgi:hypothetical protein